MCKCKDAKDAKDTKDVKDTKASTAIKENTEKKNDTSIYTSRGLCGYQESFESAASGAGRTDENQKQDRKVVCDAYTNVYKSKSECLQWFRDFVFCENRF